MSLIKFNNRFPWNLPVLDNLLDTDEYFESNSLLPAINIKENDENFEIELAVPGFSKNDFKVSIENNLLHVSAEKSNKEEEKEEGYIRKEFSYNSFKRTLRLPENINQKKEVKATFKHGILKINLLKLDIVKQIPKKMIEVV